MSADLIKTQIASADIADAIAAGEAIANRAFKSGDFGSLTVPVFFIKDNESGFAAQFLSNSFLTANRVIQVRDIEGELGIFPAYANAAAANAALSADVLYYNTATGVFARAIGPQPEFPLTAAGSADGKWSGTTITGVSGYSQAFGDLVTLDKDDSRWEAVDISVAAAETGDARGLLGMVVSAGTDGNACKILLHGTIRADANFPALTIGAPVYASTAGDVVVTQPATTDHVIRIIGHALTADELFFNPGNAWITKT
jgi:hypothetical protein